MYGLNNDLASANNTNKIQNSAKINKSQLRYLLKEIKKIK